jgi:hypothetical protein
VSDRHGPTRCTVAEALLLCLVAWLLLACLCLLMLRVAPHLEPKPAPVEPPDIGWHMALDRYGDLPYRIDLAYGEMTDAQRDDANRFAHQFPEGESEP